MSKRVVMKLSIKCGLLAFILGTGFAVHQIKEERVENKSAVKVESKERWANPQNALNEAFGIIKSDSISRVIYDPVFEQTELYVRSKLEAIGAEQQTIENYLTKNKDSALGNHYMNTVSFFRYTGDNEKRPVFVREKFFKDPDTKGRGDLISALRHEEVHAKEESEGYELSNRRLKSDEIVPLLREKMLRVENVYIIGEFDAYTTQFEAALTEKEPPSTGTLKNTKQKAYSFLFQIESAINMGTLTSIEKDHARTKLRKHKKAIQSLKKMYK